MLKYGIGHADQSMDVMNQMQWKEVTFLVPVGASGGLDAVPDAFSGDHESAECVKGVAVL